MPKSESTRARTGLPAANLRLGRRTLPITMETQQEFAREAIASWHDLTEIPSLTDDGRHAPLFGPSSAQFAVASAKRALHYASGLTKAAIDTQTAFNARPQQAIADWQSKCPQRAAGPSGGFDFASQLKKLMTPPTA